MQLTTSTINMKTPAHLNNEFIYTHHTEPPRCLHDMTILRIHHRCVLNDFPSHPWTECGPRWRLSGYGLSVGSFAGS
jgi:hypothetical protein